MLWTKFVLNSIFYKKLSGCMSLSLSRVELGASKDCHFWNILMHWNGKVDSLKGRMLPKIPSISKNTSYKNCSELNFLRWNLLKVIESFLREFSNHVHHCCTLNSWKQCRVFFLFFFFFFFLFVCFLAKTYRGSFFCLRLSSNIIFNVIKKLDITIIVLNFVDVFLILVLLSL